MLKALIRIFHREPELASEEIQAVANLILAGKFQKKNNSSYYEYRGISYYASGLSYEIKVKFKDTVVRPLNEAELKLIHLAHRQAMLIEQKVRREAEFQAKRDLKTFLYSTFSKETLETHNKD